MAEWSKALDLSSSIRKNAQVRTLLEADLLNPARGRYQAQPLWRSWQRVGFIALRSRVRPPPEAFFGSDAMINAVWSTVLVA